MHELFLVISSQISGAPNLWSSHHYTLASVITVLGGVVAILARAYVRARDDRDKMVNDTLEKVMRLVVSSTEAHAMQKSSNSQVAEALKALDRRIERLEGKIHE